MERFEQVLFAALSQVMSEVWHQTESELAAESNAGSTESETDSQ